MRALLALMLAFALPAAAYDIPTHKELARRTVELATSGDNVYRDVYLHQGPIIVGVAAEDAGTPYPRFLHHFYDPDTGLGMPENAYSVIFGNVQGAQFLQRSGRYLSALQWGLEAMPDPRDWRASIEAYDDTDDARERAYEGVGHALHLLEDMAQPDHARNRPHPGNYLQDYLELLDRLAPELAHQVRTHVGYERLWHEITDWPRGEKVHLQTSLKDAFDVMAYVSHKAEDDQRLPSRDKQEGALGLGSLNVSRELSRIAGEQLPPQVGPAVGLATRALNDDLTAAGWLIFRDNLWAQYEINAPLVPTIPWPQRDAYTEKHVEMGKRLLKLSEEHGAGLLRLYHDIVNPPAYVESVELLQGGQSKYRAGWKPANPGRDGHITSRTLTRERNETLKQGDLTEVRIRFGPTYKHGGVTIREAVGDVQVWVEGASGSRTPVSLLGFTRDPEASEAFLLTGSFVPSESGTLRISGHDLDEHFPRPGGPIGEELDSDPATCARATWGNSADGAPYPFTGYESGADINHAFTIEGECVTGPISADLVNSYRWGTWRGTIHWGRPANGPRPGRVDVTTEVTLRAALSLPGSVGAVSTELQGGNPVAIVPNSHTGVGHVQGTFRVEASGVLQDWATTGTVVDAGGAIGLRPGSPGERCEYGWHVQFNDDPDLKISNVETVQGETCVDGNVAGRTSDAGGEKSWSFHFTPGDPPPHVPLLLKHIEESAPVFQASGEFDSMIAQMLMPVYQARPAAASTYMPSLIKIGELSSKMRAFDGLPDAYDDSFAAACEAWLSSAPDADAKYQQALEEFRQTYEQYRQHLHALEAEMAGLADALANQVNSASPAVASKLRQASQKLREKGIGAFGTR
jgi:hypothetical protein